MPQLWGGCKSYVISLPHLVLLMNASKSWPITKEEHRSTTQTLFANVGLSISTDGWPHLGAPIRTQEYVASFAQNKVQQWVSELKTLTKIAATQPCAAYTAFIYGLMNRWSYHARTLPHFSSCVLPSPGECNQVWVASGRCPADVEHGTAFLVRWNWCRKSHQGFRSWICFLPHNY